MGTIVTIDLKGREIATQIDRPSLEILQQAIGGGYIEVVPMFTDFPYNGELVDCIAFCDEDGKNKGMEMNPFATARWQQSLKRQGHPGLLDKRGNMIDYLVGQIAIVFGDRAFMEAL